MQTLVFVLPGLSEIYGEHWENISEALSLVFKDVGGGEEGLPLLVSSFRLFARLKSMAEGESNDDLQDVWLERKNELSNAIVTTIAKFGKSRSVVISVKFSKLTLNRCLDHVPSTSGCCRRTSLPTYQYHPDWLD